MSPDKVLPVSPDSFVTYVPGRYGAKNAFLTNLVNIAILPTMKTLPLAVVKTNLSSVLKEVQTGSEIAISYGKKRETIAVIVPYKEYKRSKKRKLGTLKGKMRVIFEKDFSMSDADLIQS